MTLLEHITPIEAARAVEANPRVARAVTDIAARAHLPEGVVREHLGRAVLDALEVIGPEYVKEMGDLIARVDRVRDRVHAFYERILNGQDVNPDTTELSRSFEDLREALLEISDPQRWAKMKSEAGPKPGELTKGGTESQPVRTAGGTPGEGGGGTGAKPPKPVDPARRWERLRDERRLGALPKHERDALAAARASHPDVVDAALRGEPGASTKLVDALWADGLPADQIGNALSAIDGLREPDLGYALGGATGTTGAASRAFGALPASEQAAVRRAAGLDPEFVRTMVNAEQLHGKPFKPGEPYEPWTPWRPEEMDAFCKKHNISGPERANLESALRKLNKEYEKSLAGRRDPASTIPPEEWTPEGRERAQLLDDPAAALGVPPSGFIARALRKSHVLAKLAADSPDHFADLTLDYLEYATKQRGKGKTPQSLHDYVLGIMTTQVRGGIYGEFSAVFRLGLDFWVLKQPDRIPTAKGTDFVVVSRRNGEIWFCDNKAIAEHSLSGVTSLVDAVAENLTKDVGEFREAVDRNRMPLPPELEAALANAAQAKRSINRLLAETNQPADSPAVQADITRICDYYGVRRVVSNSLGQLSQLSAALAQLGIDLANLEGAANELPSRELKKGGQGSLP